MLVLLAILFVQVCNADLFAGFDRKRKPHLINSCWKVFMEMVQTDALCHSGIL